MKPKVSVIMPVLNAQSYIGKAIESVLNQTLTDFEFLVMDDGSTDETVSIAKGYKDNRIKIVRGTKPKGVAYRLNQGLKIARTELVARMDADDISLPQRLETQFDYMIKQPRISVLGSWVEVIDNQNRSVTTWKYEADPVVLKWRNLFKNPVAHPAVMYRKIQVLKVGGYSQKYEGAEDYDLWSRMIETNRFSNIQSVLLKYRLHECSVGNLNRDRQLRLATEISKRNISRYMPITNNELTSFKVKRGVRISVARLKKNNNDVLERIKTAFLEKEKPSKQQLRLINRYSAKEVGEQ